MFKLMQRELTIAILCGVAVVAAQSAPALAQGGRRVVIAAEFGAGMASGFDGQIKSVALRELLPGALEQAGGTEVGIIAFGNRPKTGCANINTVQPLGVFEAQKTVKVFNTLRAHRARTPMSDALTAAAAMLQAPGGSGAAGGDIILIAGGLDTCKKDPCAAARQIAEVSRGTIRVELIGIGLQPEQIEGLRCIPELTGGRFTQVGTRAALDGALVLALSGAGAAQPAAQSPSAVSGPPGLALSLRFAGKDAAIAAPARWTVLRIKPDQTTEPVQELTEVAPQLELPVGRYRVTATLDAASVTKDFDVADGAPAAAVLDLAAGVLAVVLTEPMVAEPAATAATEPAVAEGAAVLAEAAQPVSGTLAVSRLAADGKPAEAVLLEVARSRSIVVPPGSYRIALYQGGASVERTVTVASGDQLTEAFDTAAGRLTIDLGDARNLGTDKGATAPPTIIVLAERDTGPIEVARAAASSARFDLPPGRYRVQALANTLTAETTVDVKAGEEARPVLAFDAGVLAIAVQLPEFAAAFADQVWLEVWTEAGGERRRLLRTTRAAQDLLLAAGEYRIEVGIGPGVARDIRSVTITSGSRTSMEVLPKLSVVGLRLLAGKATTARDVVWEVLDAQGAQVLETAQPQPRLALAPGSYRIVATTRGSQTDTTVELTAGEARDVDVSPE